MRGAPCSSLDRREREKQLQDYTRVLLLTNEILFVSLENARVSKILKAHEKWQDAMKKHHFSDTPY